MDNVNYNFEIVETLYQAKKTNCNPIHFNKPLTLLLISIIECIFYDFVKRVSEYSGEKIPNLEDDVTSETKAKTLDQLNVLISHIKKNNLLRVSINDKIYEDLDFLRKIRNRFHIQNCKQQLKKNECDVFTDKNLQIAEKVVERICEVLCHVYPRPNKKFVPMSDFPRPWESNHTHHHY